jgi:hypothetical protein
MKVHQFKENKRIVKLNAKNKIPQSNIFND